MPVLVEDVERKVRVVIALGPAALAADFGKLAPLTTDVRSILTSWFDI